MLPDLGTDSGPASLALDRLLLLPKLLRQLLDEAIAVVSGAEAMAAHGICPQMIGLPPVTAMVAPEM